ncbi:MAG: ATPase, T2SS/T4P/T4SS family [Planctomycetota bacterium]
MRKIDLDSILEDLTSDDGSQEEAAPSSDASGSDAPQQPDDEQQRRSDDDGESGEERRLPPMSRRSPGSGGDSGQPAAQSIATIAMAARRAVVDLGDEPEEGSVDVDPGAEGTDDSFYDVYDPANDEDSDSGQGLRDLLLARGVADRKQLVAAETIVKQSPHTTISSVLLEQGVEEIPLMEAVAAASRLPFERVEIGDDPFAMFDGTMVQRLGVDFCKKSEVLPLRVEGRRVVLGTSRPEDVFTLDDTRLRLKAQSIKVVVVPGSDIRAALDLLDDGSSDDVDVDSLLGDIEEDDVQLEKASQDEVDLEREAAESPVIRYVNYIIQTAVKEGASDIHIEPGERTLKVRFRIDGLLFEMMQPPGKMAAAITSRLKIMANLDISERRLPQDGRIRCTVQGRKLDLRMSTIPSAVGEKTVLRILDTKSINVELDDLGFDENTLTVWSNQINQPHGIVLVTGPTGSGKTTTLYASLRKMDKKSRNISTVEDPVEYHLEGITQTQMHEKIGMTFAKALKALLRQDPDIIMVGEIRDLETAHTAVQAALTGHLVLSTLHTNDAPSSITRLVNIGIEPFLIGAAVNATLAQRLVRRICPNCRREAELTDELREFLEMQGIAPETVYEGEGCSRCRNTGHAGRLGIYELLVVDDFIRDIIARNPNVTEFRRTCCERGMVTLREDGFTKVRSGMTTVQEVLRVTEATI